MNQYRGGLNYVPMLTQDITPPCSGRSRIHLNKKRSQSSPIYYNGNYEGDSSMFRHKLCEIERLSLVDTESDTELHSGTTRRSSNNLRQGNDNSLIWRLVQLFMLNFIKPELREKMSTRVDSIRTTAAYIKLAKWTKIILVFFTYFIYLTTIVGKYLTALGHFCWKQRVIFHNLVRRLLWRLTLAKCSDLTLFILILLSIIPLFFLSSIGFVISICGCLKNAFNYSGHILKKFNQML